MTCCRLVARAARVGNISLNVPNALDAAQERVEILTIHRTEAKIIAGTVASVFGFVVEGIPAATARAQVDAVARVVHSHVLERRTVVLEASNRTKLR